MEDAEEEEGDDDLYAEGPPGQDDYDAAEEEEDYFQEAAEHDHHHLNAMSAAEFAHALGGVDVDEEEEDEEEDDVVFASAHDERRAEGRMSGRALCLRDPARAASPSHKGAPVLFRTWQVPRRVRGGSLRRGCGGSLGAGGGVLRRPRREGAPARVPFACVCSVSGGRGFKRHSFARRGAAEAPLAPPYP